MRVTKRVSPKKHLRGDPCGHSEEIVVFEKKPAMFPKTWQV
jgi:hypothetical protein